MKIAEVFGPPANSLWKMVKQCGVDYVVGGFGGSWDKERKPDEKPWSLGPMTRLKKAYEDGGFQLEVIEARPPLTKAKLGLDGRDAEIDEACDLLVNMGKLGIPVWCYEWMPVINWTPNLNEHRHSRRRARYRFRLRGSQEPATDRISGPSQTTSCGPA